VEPESVFYKWLICLLLIIIIADCVFTKHVITEPSNVQNYFTGNLKILIQLGCKSSYVGDFHVCKD